MCVTETCWCVLYISNMLRRMQIWASSKILASFVCPRVFNSGWNLTTEIINRKQAGVNRLVSKSKTVHTSVHHYLLQPINQSIDQISFLRCRPIWRMRISGMLHSTDTSTCIRYYEMKFIGSKSIAKTISESYHNSTTKFATRTDSAPCQWYVYIHRHHCSFILYKRLHIYYR